MYGIPVIFLDYLYNRDLNIIESKPSTKEDKFQFRIESYTFWMTEYLDMISHIENVDKCLETNGIEWDRWVVA